MIRKVIILGAIVFGGLGVIFGQDAPLVDKEKEARQEKEAAFNSRVDGLRNVGKDNIIRDRYKDTKVYIEKIKPIYRDLDEDELRLLSPDREDKESFQNLTEKDDWGLTKLIVEKGCNQESSVVKSSAHCAKYKMPGEGASFSFREMEYRVRRLADITLSGNGFETMGVLKHGILVNIGNEPLESLTLKHKKLKTIVGFKPVTDFDLAVNLVTQLKDGIKGPYFTYGSILPVEEGATYVLRSIAYRGQNAHTVEDITYDELEFDKRRDIIVALKVVRRIPGESATILWRVLDNKKSPKLGRKR